MTTGTLFFFPLEPSGHLSTEHRKGWSSPQQRRATKGTKRIRRTGVKREKKFKNCSGRKEEPGQHKSVKSTSKGTVPTGRLKVYFTLRPLTDGKVPTLHSFQKNNACRVSPASCRHCSKKCGRISESRYCLRSFHCFAERKVGHLMASSGLPAYLSFAQATQRRAAGV